jgi:Ca2+-binding EF-hand superfamily protein
VTLIISKLIYTDGFCFSFDTVKAISDFGLTIDIEQLIEEADQDGSGFIDFEEFTAMLTPPE